MRLRGFVTVALLAVVPWLPLRHGQYLFDDLQLVEHNPALAAVGSSADAFLFSLKPSKPVSNVALALGQVAGGGRVEGQRWLSLTLHALTAALLFWWLSARVSFFTAVLGALWFAWLPLHAEALSVAWFRMDVLGTCFTLLAVILASTSRWLLAFLAVGAAALSKEVFVGLAPALVFAATGRKRALTYAIPWAIVVAFLLLSDRGSAFSYDGVLGFSVLGTKQLFLAPIAWAEWAVKTFSGLGLTTTSLLDRWVAAPNFVWAVTMVLTGLALGGGLWVAARRKSLAAPWFAVVLFSLVLYASIPNLNLGAERYGYFPAACLAVALALSVAVLPKGFPWLLAAHALVLLFPLQRRLSELESRVAHASAEVKHHAEVGLNWSNLALTYLDLGPQFHEDGEAFLAQAHLRLPDSPRVWLTEFAYRFQKGDAESYAELWRNEGHRFASDPKVAASLEYQLGLLMARRGDCEAARARFRSAERRDAHLGRYPKPFCG